MVIGARKKEEKYKDKKDPNAEMIHRYLFQQNKVSPSKYMI